MEVINTMQILMTGALPSSPDYREPSILTPFGWYKQRPIDEIYDCAAATPEGYVYGRTMKNQGVSPLPWVLVRGKLRNERSLIDSGAPINLISEDKLQQFEHRLTSSQLGRIVEKKGNIGHQGNWYNVTVTLNNGESVTIPMLCGLDDRIGIILGMPFLQQTKAVINLPEQIITTVCGVLECSSNNYFKPIENPNDQPVKTRVMAVLDTSEIIDDKVTKALRNTALSPLGLEHARSVLMKFSDVWQESLGNVLPVHSSVCTDRSTSGTHASQDPSYKVSR